MTSPRPARLRATVAVVFSAVVMFLCMVVDRETGLENTEERRRLDCKWEAWKHHMNCNAPKNAGNPIKPRVQRGPLHPHQEPEAIPRIIFAGDSVMNQLFNKVVNLKLLEEASPAEMKRLISDRSSDVVTESTHTMQTALGKPLECYKVDVQLNFVRNRTTQVCFFATGREAGRLRIPLSECQHACSTPRGMWNVDLGNAFACLHHVGLVSSSDVIVANAGVHHNDARTLQTNVVNFLTWRSSLHDPPCTLWRQTLPQHFPTETGAYGIFAHPALKSCSPLHLPPWTEQKYNDVSDGLINRTDVPIIYLWRKFADDWDQHPGVNIKGKLDCTHWPDHDDGTANPVVVKAASLMVTAMQSLCYQLNATLSEQGKDDGNLRNATGGAEAAGTASSPVPAACPTTVAAANAVVGAAAATAEDSAPFKHSTISVTKDHERPTNESDDLAKQIREYLTSESGGEAALKTARQAVGRDLEKNEFKTAAKAAATSEAAGFKVDGKVLRLTEVQRTLHLDVVV